MVKRKEKLTRGIGLLPNRIQLLSASFCLMALIGCGSTTKVVAIPDSRMGEPHPTKPGYECFSTGYLQEILKEIDICTNSE